MHRNTTYRNKSPDKAELFDDVFFEQFSDSSYYGIDIDWANDMTTNNIDLNIPRIGKFLYNK